MGLGEDRVDLDWVKLWAAHNSGSYKMKPKFHCLSSRYIDSLSDKASSLCIWQLLTIPSYFLRIALISQEARGFVHCLLPGLSITLKLKTCPRSKRALPQHSNSGLGNSLCILLDKQVIHKNCQEFILELPLKKEEFEFISRTIYATSFQFCYFFKKCGFFTV